MTIEQQHPIPSGFGKDTNVGEILRGVDLTGKTVIVTGGYSGIGLATTRAFTAAGATVTVPARRPAQAREQLEGIEGVEVDAMDLADLGSVADFAERFVATGRPLNLLINNAGVMANPLTRVGPGWESQFAINHLGHYALTNRLWPALAAAGSAGGARVISLTSRGHKFSAMRWDDLQWNHDYDKWQAYGQAKTANVLFTVQIDALGAGVRAFSVYPGGLRTPLQRHLSQEEMMAMGWIDEQGNDIFPWKSPEQGAATTAWAATSAQLDGIGGVYCEDSDVAVIADPDTEQGKQRGVNPYAVDPEQAARLWSVSADLTDVNAFSTARAS